MTSDTFAYLARIAALRARFADLRAELTATTDAEARSVIFDEAVATLHRIRELETQRV